MEPLSKPDISGTDKSVMNSEVSSFQGFVKHTNEAFGTDIITVLFTEVSSIQGCPYRGVSLYIQWNPSTYTVGHP